jgi:hypothetical protein
MRKEWRESPLSEAARGLRATTRLAVVLAALLLLATLAAARNWIPRELGSVALPLFLASVLTAIWFGVKAHRRALADREIESGRAMIVAIAAQLGRQDDASLERIKTRGGPAAEAAGMILQGRAEKAKHGMR